jgi:hypothetical protein
MLSICPRRCTFQLSATDRRRRTKWRRHRPPPRNCTRSLDNRTAGQQSRMATAPETAPGTPSSRTTMLGRTRSRVHLETPSSVPGRHNAERPALGSPRTAEVQWSDSRQQRQHPTRGHRHLVSPRCRNSQGGHKPVPQIQSRMVAC